MEKQRIGVLGTGSVGQALGTGLRALGHEVRMGSRDARNPKAHEWAAKAGGSAGTFADAAAFGEVLVLATKGEATEAVLRALPADATKGKIVVDTTNPLTSGAAGLELFVGQRDSLGEIVRRALPQARVVKAFNCVGAHLMVHPKLAGGPPDMFIAGDDAAKAWVSELLQAWGWGVVDLGGIEASRWLEPMAGAWVAHALRTGNWNQAFRLLR